MFMFMSHECAVKGDMAYLGFNGSITPPTFIAFKSYLPNVMLRITF